MKIKNINIISFGGLKNFSLSLEEGLNCIYGENEQGKSTLMAFVKMMFYGSDRGGSQISKNVRKKYTPWDGSAMAGSILFSFGGKDYKLEREFKSSNSTDRVYLTDMSLGERVNAQGDIGAKLFGLSAAAFERSIFIGQLGFPSGDTAAESEINARLSNTVSTGDELNSLEDVRSRIEKARFSLISKSGKTGEYHKNLSLANDLKEKLNASASNHKKYLEGKAKLTEFTAQTDDLCKKAAILKEQISKEQDVKNAEKLRDFIKTKEELEEIKNTLTLSDGTPADQNLLNSLKFSLSKLENAKASVNAKEKELGIIRSQLDTLLNGPAVTADETPEKLGTDLLSLDRNANALKAQIAENQNRLNTLKTECENQSKAKSVVNPVLLILGLLLLVAGGVAFAFAKLPAIIICGVGLIVLTLGFILKPRKKPLHSEEELGSLQALIENQTSHLEDITAQITDKKTKLEAIRLASSSNSQVIEAQRSQLELAKNELAVLKDNETDAKEKLAEFLTRFGEQSDLEEQIPRLEAACQKQKELKQHISFLLRDLNNITYEQAKEKLAAMGKEEKEETVDFGKIKETYEKLLGEITKRRSTESAVETELKGLISQVENPDLLEKALKEKADTLESQKYFCDSLDLALEVLEESFAEMRANYGSKLERNTAEILSQITDGKYTGLTVSKSFELNVSSQNSIGREADYLSSGTFDQAYLSLRLAVSRLLCEKEALPILLDDALTQYDDKRAKTTLSFLKDYCEASQGIIFTCHNHIKEICEDLECSVKTL